MKRIVFALLLGSFCFVAKAQSNKMAPPPPPPPPPVMEAIDAPPPPPPPPPVYKNKQGYNLEVYSNNGKGSVVVRKKGFEKTIPLSEWKKNKKMYETKYGKIPPPPPVEEEVIFTPPVIEKN